MEVAYLYLDYKETQSHSLSDVLGSILQQLLRGRTAKTLCAPAQALLESMGNVTSPSNERIVSVLQGQLALPEFKRLFVVIDALDEYPESSRRDLLGAIRGISSDKISFLITSRPSDRSRSRQIQCGRCHVDDLKNLKLYFYCSECLSYDACYDCYSKDDLCMKGHRLIAPRQVQVEVRTPDNEIEEFVRSVLQDQLGALLKAPSLDRSGMSIFGKSRLAIICQDDPALVDEFMREIPNGVVDNANGLFLLAKLHTDSLMMQNSEAAVRSTLKGLSVELGSSYLKIFERIQAQDSEHDKQLATRALSWIILTRRALKPPEFLQALAIKPSEKDFDVRGQTHIDMILRVTMGLVAADPDNGVHMFHKTAYDHFARRWHVLHPEASIGVTLDILNFLTYDTFSLPCTGVEEDQQANVKLRKFPLLYYASAYWGAHVRGILELPDVLDQSRGLELARVRTKSLEIVKNDLRRASITQLAWYAGSQNPQDVAWDVRGGTNALHICAFNGLDSCILALLDGSPAADVNSQDDRLGQTPLMYACKRGFLSTATLLLKRGAWVNATDQKGNTAIFIAFHNGHPQVVEHILTDSSVDPPLDLNATCKEDHGRTLLMVAAFKGHDNLVSMILKRPGIQVNLQDADGYTALALAASTTHGSTVSSCLNVWIWKLQTKLDQHLLS